MAQPLAFCCTVENGSQFNPCIELRIDILLAGQLYIPDDVFSAQDTKSARKSFVCGPHKHSKSVASAQFRSVMRELKHPSHKSLPSV